MRFKLGHIWAASAATLVAALVALLLSLALQRAVQHVNAAVEGTALQLMAPIYPTRMCVNGSRDSISTLATTAPLKLACNDVSGMWQPKKAIVNSVAVEMDLLNELARCGAITSCYFAGEVPRFYSTDLLNKEAGHNNSMEQIWHRSIPSAMEKYDRRSTCNITDIGAIGEMLMRRTANSSSNFSSTFYLPAAAGQTDAGMVNHYLQVTRYGIVAQLLNVPVLSGTWRLEFADKSDVLWLHISQTAATAQCLGNSQHNFCDVVAPLANSTQKVEEPAVLVPNQFVSYRCFGGVEVAYLQTLETYKAMAKSSITGKLLGFWYHREDALYALYTAAMAAMFGAFAALVGVLSVALVAAAAAVVTKVCRGRTCKQLPAEQGSCCKQQQMALPGAAA
jgi:hypothetical protein